MNYLLIAFGVILTYAAIEFLIIKYNGTFVPAPDIPRSPQTFGTGQRLTYAVMGDSTAIGQGTEYEHSYAFISAKHMAKDFEVTLINTGVSGARIYDVAYEQLSKASSYTPDVVLLGVGANDTTHLTDLKQIEKSLQKIVDDLRQSNPSVRIIATRSPALDSVSRFPPVSKYLLRLRTIQVNGVFDKVVKRNGLTSALIAENTREAFLADSTLTASDNFHPNERGYGLWIPLINEALDRALKKA